MELVEGFRVWETCAIILLFLGVLLIIGEIPPSSQSLTNGVSRVDSSWEWEWERGRAELERGRVELERVGGKYLLAPFPLPALAPLPFGDG